MSLKDHRPGEDDPLHAVKTEIAAHLRACLEQIIMGTAYPKQLFTFQVMVVSDQSACYAQVFPACLNSCITLLNQTGIAQKEAPCFAVTVGVAEADMQVVGKSGFKFVDFETSGCPVLLEVVQNQTSGAVLHLRTLYTDSSFISADDILADPMLEATLRRLGEQITEVTFSE